MRFQRFIRHTATSAASVTLLAAATILLPCRVTGQESDSTATLTGRVVSAMTGGPLKDVRVTLENSGFGTFTDSAGQFTIPDAPAGRDTVGVSLIGFAEEKVPLELAAGRVTRVTLMLSESVLRVEDITVEVPRRPEMGKLSGFYERRQRGVGAYISPEEIDERKAQHPSDLLRTVPGVSVGPSRLGRAEVRITRARLNCHPTYYIDGLALKSFRMDELNQDDLLAIEVYRGPSETPPQFRPRGNSCGTIVVWTREGRERRAGSSGDG